MGKDVPRKKKSGVSPMMRKLMRALKAFTVKFEGKTYLVTEGDTEPVLDALAEVIAERYGRIPRTDFQEDRPEYAKESKKLGVGGGWAFQSMLNQKRIPYIVQEPFSEWPVHTPLCDFIIPKPEGGVLGLEIKTFPEHAQAFYVKKKLWDGMKEKPDALIALKKLPRKFEPPGTVGLDRWIKKLPIVRVEGVEIALPEKATSAVVHVIVGWISGAEFDEKKQFAPKGGKPWSKYAACYWCDWSELHDWKELEPKILECSIKSRGEVGGWGAYWDYGVGRSHPKRMKNRTIKRGLPPPISPRKPRKVGVITGAPDSTDKRQKIYEVLREDISPNNAPIISLFEKGVYFNAAILEKRLNQALTIFRPEGGIQVGVYDWDGTPLTATRLWEKYYSKGTGVLAEYQTAPQTAPIEESSEEIHPENEKGHNRCISGENAPKIEDFRKPQPRCLFLDKYAKKMLKIGKSAKIPKIPEKPNIPNFWRGVRPKRTFKAPPKLLLMGYRK